MKKLQQQIDGWIKQYGVRYFNEMTNTVLLMEETGELARHIARKYGEQSYKKSEEASQSNENIKEEMGDILFILCCLANQMEIDLDAVMEKNLEKKTMRDHDRHLNNPKL